MSDTRGRKDSADQTAANLSATHMYLAKLHESAGFPFHDADEVGKKIYLVHCSKFPPREGEITAGMLLNGEISSTSTTIRARPTLHHSFGRVVPNFSHRTSMDIFGTKIDTSPDIGADPNAFAFLEPLQAFDGELLGGSTYDFRTLDKHVYGESAILVSPQSRLEEIKNANPNFKGRIIAYDIAEKKLADVVKNILENETAWVFEYSFANLDYFQSINGIPVSIIEIGKFFKERQWDAEKGTDQFVPLENILKLLNEGFFRHSKNPSIPIASHLPPFDVINILVVQARYYLAELRRAEIKDNLNPRSLASYIAWIQDIENWLNLFDIDIQLRKENKSIFIENNNLFQFVESRHDSEKLKTLQAALIELPTTAFIDHAVVTTQDPRWTFVSLVENTTFNLNNLPPTSLGMKIKAYALLKTLLDVIRKDTEMVEQQVLEHFPKLTLSEPEKSAFQALLLEFMKITANTNDLAIRFINTPHGRCIWNKIAREPEPDALTDISINHLRLGLNHFYEASRTEVYLTPSHPRHFKANLLSMHVAWYYRTQTPSTVADLFKMVERFKLFDFGLIYPMGNANEPDGLNSFFREIKKETYGSLSDVFAVLGLETEFKLKFPDEKDFWRNTEKTITEIAVDLYLQRVLRDNFIKQIEDENKIYKEGVLAGEKLGKLDFIFIQKLARFYETGDAQEYDPSYNFSYRLEPNLAEANFWYEIIARSKGETYHPKISALTDKDEPLAKANMISTQFWQTTNSVISSASPLKDDHESKSLRVKTGKPRSTR